MPGAENGLSLMSASKGWNLAGLRGALLIAGPAAAGDLARVPFEVSVSTSHLGVIAHTAAFRDGGEWLDALLTGLDDNRRLLAALLAEHLPHPLPPRSGHLSRLARLPRPGPRRRPRHPVPRRGRVALNSGSALGTGGGHVRLNLATAPELITEAVCRMATAVA